MVLVQVPFLIFASLAQGWWLFVALLGTMVFIFGCLPFTDAMIVRYVDDSMRSRVAGMRLAVSFSVSSVAVWLLGPVRSEERRVGRAGSSRWDRGAERCTA